MELGQNLSVTRRIEPPRKLIGQRLFVQIIVLRGARDSAVIGKPRAVGMPLNPRQLGIAEVIFVPVILGRIFAPTLEFGDVHPGSSDQFEPLKSLAALGHGKKRQRFIEMMVRDFELGQNRIEPLA